MLDVALFKKKGFVYDTREQSWEKIIGKLDWLTDKYFDSSVYYWGSLQQLDKRKWLKLCKFVSSVIDGMPVFVSALESKDGVNIDVERFLSKEFELFGMRAFVKGILPIKYRGLIDELKQEKEFYFQDLYPAQQRRILNSYVRYALLSHKSDARQIKLFAEYTK